jgi:hypothetical protein
VESRAAAIRALKDGHIASITGQLTLQQSKYPSHIRKMPMMQFLKEYCPNTEATTRPDGTIQLNIIHDKAHLLGGSQAQGGQMGGGASVENTPGFCVPRTSRTLLTSCFIRCLSSKWFMLFWISPFCLLCTNSTEQATLVIEWAWQKLEFSLY